MKKKFILFFKNISESTSACLFLMLQGNLLVITLGHWVVALQTSIFAGVLATSYLFIFTPKNYWQSAIMLGVITGFVDYFVHEGLFSEKFLEAVLTGLGATILSLLITRLIRFYKALRLEVKSKATETS
ncbi:MAG: hypothetical protein P8J61_00195 [Gammaproteobacteria bacterium]|jgi:hypothetical protein|nr:hypothetical protein [Gammaproteobacteria bacterium]